MNGLKQNKYGFEVFRLLNQWQVCLMVSNNVKPIDHYVTVNSDGKYSLVYVFKRDEAIEYIESFRNHQLEIGDYVMKFDK